MDVYLLMVAAVILLLVYYIHIIQMSARNMPPGPFVVPLLGSLPAIWLRRPIFNMATFRPWETVQMLSKDFGDLMSFTFFSLDAVVIASYELLEEVASMEEYSFKVAHEYYTYPRTFGKEMGILFTYTPALWSEMRKFTVRTLRDFGFGKSYTMHSIIIQEVATLINEFNKSIQCGDGVVKFRNTFSLSVLNVLWCMVAGTRYEHDDPKLQKLLDNTFEVSKACTFGNPMEVILPYTRKIAPDFFSARLRHQSFDNCHNLSKTLIEESKAKGVYLTEPENYIEVFLKKIHENKEDDEKSLYSEHQLQSMIEDLLLVGSLTLNATLNYGVLFLTINPEIQVKCQAEIDSVVPPHLAPSMDDIAKMPYFQAFVLEVHRCANVIPNPVPRITPKDWNLRGYKIPKGTIILSNHYSVNKDDRIWGDANVFRPERFINAKGEFLPDPRVTVFGFGKRMCIGITLVNCIIPLFLASLLHNFQFTVVPGTKPPTSDPEIGISLSPQEFPVQLIKRGLTKPENYGFQQ